MVLAAGAHDGALGLLVTGTPPLVAHAPPDTAMGALTLAGVPVAPAQQQSDSEDAGAAVAPEELEGEGRGDDEDDDDGDDDDEDDVDMGGGAHGTSEPHDVDFVF